MTRSMGGKAEHIMRVLLLHGRAMVPLPKWMRKLGSQLNGVLVEWQPTRSQLTFSQTVDRVLDVMLLPPKAEKKASIKRGKRILSVSDTSARGSENPDGNGDRPDGVEPPVADQMDIDTWESKAGRVLEEKDVDEVARMVSWCYVSWPIYT
jgi:hypothetical protein